MVKFFIDPGHGGTDPGAVGNGLQEKNLTLTISKKIRDLLLQYNNTQVRLSREGDQLLTLKQRTDMANAWGADFLLSVHINAGGGTGYEDFRYNTLPASSSTGMIQSTIHRSVMGEIRSYNVVDRGAKAANFHMLRESAMPAILTENLFIDRAADANLLKNNTFLDAVARGHVNGLVRAFGLTRKQSASAPVKGAEDMGLEAGRLAAKPEVGNLGVLKVLEGTILREGPVYTTPIIGRIEAGGEYKVYDYQGGWYNVGAGWIFSEYVNFLPNRNAKMSL
ncbi:N-acetylmuramoyl-L-alanine amidase [Cytobacillus gottheilii]|uniref:N-acetylmuramoyl-L-alanine amidase n=1 Tax=Cytobacillus gottheilii TaxID=859144 RepID=UPI0009B99B9A|nr:N-acetylmuramoyl-L-alanine amidase [Cytobacillus gottheilii]